MSDIKIYGSFSVAETPTDDNDLATKGYVDSLTNTTKAITTLTGSSIVPSKSGQIFYKSISSPTTFTLDVSGTNFKAGTLFEFYLIVSKTGVSLTLPSGWVWNGGSAPSTSSSGYYFKSRTWFVSTLNCRIVPHLE